MFEDNVNMSGAEVKFSIVVPLYNKERHIKRAMRSVLNQSHRNFELIVVDDNSTDSSVAIVEAIQDPRVRLLKRTTPGPGGYAARNLGIISAQNPWIAFLDADDEWNDGYLAEIAKAIVRNPGCRVFCSGFVYQNTHDQRPARYTKKNRGQGSHLFSFGTFLRNKPIWTGAVVIEKDLIIKAGKFPEEKSKRGGDQDCWLRVMFEARQGCWVDYIGAIYHRDSDNMVTRSVPFEVNQHVMLETIGKLLKLEQDQKNRLALKVHWNKTASVYFKNAAKSRVLSPKQLEAYYWTFSKRDFRILLYFIYSLRNLRLH